jgi:hypothetical protein
MRHISYFILTYGYDSILRPDNLCEYSIQKKRYGDSFNQKKVSRIYCKL